MNLCLEEAAAIIIEMWGLIDGQPTWVAFKFGERTVVRNEKKIETRNPSPTRNNVCHLIWAPNSSEAMSLMF